MKKNHILSIVIALCLIGFLGTAFARSEDEALRLFSQGREASKYGRYQDALGYFEESLKIFRSLNHPKGISANLSHIGLVHHDLGRCHEALRYYGEALEIDRKLGIPQNIAIGLNNIGAVYKSLGQYDKALSYHEESLKMRRKLNIPQSIARSLNNIGAVYDDLGRYDEALSYYEESLKINRKLGIPQDIAINLNNIGVVYGFLGRYDDALRYHGEALEINRKLNIPQDIARSLNNIGAVYLTLKDYRKAEGLFREAEKEQARTSLKQRGNAEMSEVYLATGRHNEALNLLKEIPPRWFDAPPSQIQYYTHHGLALKGEGRFKDASGEFLKAVSISEEMRLKVKGEKAGFFTAGSLGGMIRAYRGLFSTLSERAIKGEGKDPAFSAYGRDLPANAFYFSESTKARVLLEAMAESARKTERIEIAEGIKKREEDLINQLQAIDSQWEATYQKGEDALKELNKRKERLKGELNQLIKELRENYPRYAALHYPVPVPAEELPLKEDEVLLEYALCDDAGYIFVVRKGGIKRIIKIPFSKERLEAKIKTFMEPMNTRDFERFSIKEAGGLYDILLAEALKDVKDNEKVIIVPDGILGLLPFEALVAKEGVDMKEALYVGDRYTITYYQSAAVLALQRNLKGDKVERPLFALGNPVYDKDDPRYIAWKEKKKEILVAGLNKYPFRGLAIKAKWGKTTETDTTGNKIEFLPLPETETEMRSIADIMGVAPAPPDILLLVNANETGLRKTDLGKYRYIHFATHASLPGMIQGINEPFILLGQVENQKGDDGFLTTTEVLDLRLNADIVILSACVTGVGKEVEGEGVANFARAFQHAGAKGVVVSLWEVASGPAVEYMKKFYGYLKAGKGGGEALRLARDEIKSKYHNPFYWAVFILHGEG